MKLHKIAPLALVLGIGLAAWPAFIDRGIDRVNAATAATPAPVTRDYEQRDKLIAFWEGAVAEHHAGDMLSPRQLAGQYLQRYRETGNIDDVLRAQNMARRSLHEMPQNIAAIGEMSAVMLALHRFREALHDVDELLTYDPLNPGFLAQKASLEMELGRYPAAALTLRRVAAHDRRNAAVETVQSRYDELTGELSRARDLLADAASQIDADIDAPAQSRAWYHFRMGELAFAAGDNAAALRDEHAAVAIFPTDNLALKDLAKFNLANHDFPAAQDAAQRGAAVTPFPETLGYQADAQAALGDRNAAAVTRDVIFAIERLGNAYHVNDRLLAIYYADHHLRPHTAFAIAEREVTVRGDEIYAQDTLAWTAAMDGHWEIARDAIAKATRYRTQDPILAYHAGIIAFHFGRHREAMRLLQTALDENPNFHPVFADDARRLIAAR